ncbi:hypothetical protein Y1Q_0006570 [Alligator mississippiensis]|uniref:Uncharacterized protein n=1 Tax=Alligator mississippiensis TaxID=8496 RepID=A0A151NT62_ALLMI|nr:hypothetical protein Y1Q_0006570 [Alligator mississippiensis]
MGGRSGKPTDCVCWVCPTPELLPGHRPRSGHRREASGAHRTTAAGSLPPTVGATWRHQRHHHYILDSTHLLWQLVVAMEDWVVDQCGWWAETFTWEAVQEEAQL